MSERPDSEFFVRSGEEIIQHLDRDMTASLVAPSLTRREKLALACRMLADDGHARTLAGQITARADIPDTYWTTNFAAGLAGTTASNLVRVDSEMRVVEGEGMANPAVRFHLWIYGARPELNCIVHTHPPYSSALSMTGEPLRVAHMDAMAFFEDCALLQHWPGVPLANEEGRLISEALGKKRSILLAHHGLLTTGSSLEEAVYLAVLFEQAAQLQVLAGLVGEVRDVPRELALKARDFLLKDSIIKGTFNYWVRRVAQRHPDVLS
ncbi:MAG: aldolase [Terriglobia bacterium]